MENNDIKFDLGLTVMSTKLIKAVLDGDEAEECKRLLERERAINYTRERLSWQKCYNACIRA